MLSQEERNLLLNFVEQCPPGTPYLRRAHITLLNEDGISHEEIALQLELPALRVRQWLRAVQKQGMMAFPEGALKLEPPFSPGDPFTAAGLAIMNNLLARLLVLESDLEKSLTVRSVHESRKNIRRFRTAIKIFSSYILDDDFKRYRKRLRKVMRRLAQPRDYAVFVQKLDSYISDPLLLEQREQSELQDLNRLADYWSKKKGQVEKETRTFFSKDKYRRLLSDLGESLRGQAEVVSKMEDPITSGSVRELAPTIISEKLSLLRTFNTRSKLQSPIHLHALRIELKELRYTAEFFKPLMGPKAAPAIQSIWELLTHLGNLNDVRVHIMMLEEQIAETASPEAELYLTVKEEELEKLVTEFMKLWTDPHTLVWREDLAKAAAAI